MDWEGLSNTALSWRFRLLREMDGADSDFVFYTSIPSRRHVLLVAATQLRMLCYDQIVREVSVVEVGQPIASR